MNKRRRFKAKRRRKLAGHNRAVGALHYEHVQVYEIYSRRDRTFLGTFLPDGTRLR